MKLILHLSISGWNSSGLRNLLYYYNAEYLLEQNSGRRQTKALALLAVTHGRQITACKVMIRFRYHYDCFLGNIATV